MRRRDFMKSATAAVLGAIAGGHSRSSPSFAASDPPSLVGRWSPVYSWPGIPIHAALLRDGAVMSFSKGDGSAGYANTFITQIPVGMPPSRHREVANNTTNLFCSGHSFLSDGRLIVMGGHEGENGEGSPDVNILSYTPDYNWQRQTSDPMNSGRWYPSSITLQTGEILVLGGERSRSEGLGVEPLPEIWQPSAAPGRRWRPLSTALKTLPLYSALYLTRSGAVFIPGPLRKTFYLDPTGTGRWSVGPTRLHAGPRDYGSSAMYEDGKVLIMGGGGTRSNPVTNTAEIIDLDATSPAWQWTGSMKYARRHLNATILPDGSVLATGGSSAPGNDASGAVFAAEMWDPVSGQWTEMASMQVSRLYHSTALLLPDGRVLSGGGGQPKAINGGTNNSNVELFSPPYLFNGPRPTIGSAPSLVRYGETFPVQTTHAADITQVAWIGLSAVTHTFNFNQRFRRLSFSRISNSLNVQAPSNSKLSPPGYYLLFILRPGTDGRPVPSVARIVGIRS
jgi:hypothetical protein